MNYQPSSALLEKYASVLVQFALNSGEGLRPGEVVYIQVPESAKPFYAPLRDCVLRAGGYPMMLLLPEGVEEKNLYTLSSDEQLQFFPAHYYRGLVDQVDHLIRIHAEADKYLLKGVPPEKIIKRANAIKPYRDWCDQKEAEGKLTWTIASYGTPAMAEEVNMSLEEYWQEIIHACYLDEDNPIAKWQETYQEMGRIQTALNQLAIDHLQVTGEGVTLKVGLGPHRQWLGGGGRNIPSFELFISPDWRQTEGEIHFSQPLYRYGNKITGIYLRFVQGKVVEARAEAGEELLREMINTPNADKIGEFSLTDSRFSRITRPMGDTLYDENIGGPQGNMHLALGNAYRESYGPDAQHLTEEEWEKLGYNQSVVHTDIISTSKRQVVASLKDGTSKTIYQDGQFTL